MKKFTAFYFRHNPQLLNGGYETTRTIEARTLASATKKAEKAGCAYGSMELLRIEPQV